jgi:antitoxin ParD1/3/4
METLTISLTKDQKAFVEAQMAEGGFRSVSKYIDTLLRAERRRQAEAYLLTLVQEAEASGPATPMTKEDWDNLKRRVWDRVAKAKESSRGKGRQKTRRRAGSR